MLKSRTILVLWLALYGVIGLASGVVGGGSGQSRGFDLLLGVVATALTYVWCKAEVLERGSVPPPRSALFAAVFAPVGVPIHFYRSRRPPRGVFVATLKACGFYLGALLVFGVCDMGAKLLRV